MWSTLKYALTVMNTILSDVSKKNQNKFFRLIVCAFLSNIFNLMGLMFSMQAVISTIAEGKIRLLANKALENIGVIYTFDTYSILLLITALMGLSYTLSMGFDSLRHHQFASLMRDIEVNADKASEAGAKFSARKLDHKIKILYRLVKMGEAILFAICIISFLAWLSLGFCVAILTILSLYIALHIPISKYTGRQNSHISETKRGPRSGREPSIDSRSKEYFVAKKEQQEFDHRNGIYSKVIYVVTMISIVLAAAINFQPGDLLVMPLIIIISIRRLLGTTSSAMKHLWFIINVGKKLDHQKT